MLKNILNLEGAQKLSNDEQKLINGGIGPGCVQAWMDINDVPCGPSGYHFVMSGGKAYCCPNT